MPANTTAVKVPKPTQGLIDLSADPSQLLKQQDSKPPTDTLKSQISEDNMRQQTEFEKHSEAIKNRIQLLEQQIDEQEKQSTLLKHEQDKIRNADSQVLHQQDGLGAKFLTTNEFAME